MTQTRFLASTTVEARPGPVLLQRVLFANSVFSAFSGAGLVLLSGPIADFLNVGSPLAILVIGIGLLGFAFFAFQTARSGSRTNGLMIFIGDVLWVIGSAIMLLTDPFSFSDGGKLAVLIIAFVVADFAIFEWIGLRRSNIVRDTH